MTSILSFLGLVFLIILIISAVQGYNNRAKEIVENRTPFYLPISNIRKDGIYMLANKGQVTNIIAIAFLSNDKVSWCSAPLYGNSELEKLQFQTSITNNIKNPKFWSNSETINNKEIIANFKNFHYDPLRIVSKHENISITCMAKRDGQLQVFERYLDDDNKPVTKWYDYKFVEFNLEN